MSFVVATDLSKSYPVARRRLVEARATSTDRHYDAATPASMIVTGSVPWGAPDANRPHEARRARWRTHAASCAGYCVELHVNGCTGAPPSQDGAVQLGRAGHVVCSAPDERSE